MVTWTIDPDGDGITLDTTVNGGMPIVQFQPGAVLTASVTDGDVSGTNKAVTTVTWQWYRSSSKSSRGTAISGATNAAYTVQDEANDNDVGKYLRVEASYSVVTGSADSASLVSDYPVKVRLGENNSLPEFASTAVTREVTEGEKGMTVGNPVTATDADRDVLNYTFWG